MALSDTRMQIETREPGMESNIGIKNDYEIPKIQTDGDNYSKESVPEIAIDGEIVSSEPEMEIQIGAVFSLAALDDNKQNESLESESLGSQTSFTGSTVSAKEDDSLNGSQSDVTCAPHEENNVDNNLYINSSIANESSDVTTDQYGGDISHVHSETSFCSVSPKHKVDVSGEVDLSARIVNKKKKDAQVAKKIKHVSRSKKTKDYPGYEDIKKYSYCYVKLSDVLKHSVIKQEVVKMEKKNETMEVEEDREMTTQELKNQQKPRPRKKKPVKITMRKWKKKKSVIKQKDETETVVVDDPLKSDTITENLQNRPNRKRKFNHNLFTDAVVFDSRGICNYADYEIKALEEEESRRGQTTIYGFRGSRPQVARTKKKLCRVKREDMPFISVKLDNEQIDKLDKSKFAVSKSVAVVRSIKCYTNHQLQKINNGSFRILKSWSKEKRSRPVKKNRKEKSKATSSSKVTAAVMMEDGSMSATRKKKENMSVTGFSGTTIPLHQQKMTHDTKNVDMSTLLLSKKPHATHPNSVVLPVNAQVKQSSVSSFDDNKGTLVSNEARVSLTGRYRKPSKKYISFITNFERNGSTAKIPTKTGVKLEQPFIEMDIAGDAEGTVRHQHLNGAIDNTKKSNNSVEVKDRMYKHEPNQATLSVQTYGDSATCTTPNVTTESANISKPVKSSPTFVMKSQSVSNASVLFPPNLLKSTVNELARVQNTKKFFQLRVGDKMVLIPADGGNIVPKAYVIDVASHLAVTKTSAEKNTRTPDFSSKKSSEVSSKHVNTETTESDLDRKSDSLGRALASAGSLDSMFPHSANQQVTSIESTGGCSGGKLTINTGNVLKQALLSPPPLSPHVESVSSLIFNSRHIPPVLSPTGLANPEGVYDDTKPPVLRQEYASCDGDNPNPSQMKSILPKVIKGSTSDGEPARAGLPAYTGGTSPSLIVIPHETRTDRLVVKKEPDHLRNFVVGASTKDTAQRNKSNTPSTLLDSQETRSKTQLTHNNVTVSENCLSSSDTGSRSDNTRTTTEIVSSEDADLRPIVKLNATCFSSKETNQTSSYNSAMALKVDQNRSVTSQSAQEDKNKTVTTSGTLFVAGVDNEANPQPEEASSYREPTDTDRERTMFGIETVTHVPANETLVQERIRKLRERLRETQADLDTAKKTIRIKKEYNEDDY
ncbi:uncharacterized protein LOC110465511 [Mizuhopecten yessoensis]|uniref:Uncharacterized protein n=1 Tax=Mizuhopecten yessoensis TaxID=6573 RepID=A0A210PRL3_MIZYE|nr:uncharacterized protein LOC110465511 [Mizuhopecten yessoensis]XP_021377072.1 uncharacterized protein LOC110465511 [Mizuhopecten yessoensis]XP_021377073.1 uncharacterized protein LOC110465511 [Mizuhopecten yessoensis]OWF39076.1 hypothetical protein KP79_PYT03924 [Mizuhopecten yessoensis]